MAFEYEMEFVVFEVMRVIKDSQSLVFELPCDCRPILNSNISVSSS